jgi:glycosyltransferase involved in cell wall biosynthesis
MNQPRVSVVIPTYNCERFLPEAIESVLQQTMTQHEVIVIDDGSTDSTAAVLQNYQRKDGDRVRAVSRQNRGVSASRNEGIQLARGKWIAFLDADDVFLPDKLEAQLAIASENPNLGMIHSGWQRVDAAGEILTIVEPWHSVPRLDLEGWLRYKPVLPSAMLFRRDWLVRSGGFDPRFSMSEDTELVLRLARSGCEAAWLRQVTVSYRQHEGNATHKGLLQAESLSAILDEFFAHKELPESILLLESSVRYNTLVWLAWYLHHTGHLVEAVQFLKRAYLYCTASPMEAIVHWADCFSEFSRSWDSELDVQQLRRSHEWRKLVQWVMGKDTRA